VPQVATEKAEEAAVTAETSPERIAEPEGEENLGPIP
jgi:hypothetical protein